MDTVASKLSEVENIISAGEDFDDISVIQLLESMTEVKNEYQNLRKDIKEVQQLQKEMTNSLIFQRKAMVNTFCLLKKKLQLRIAEREN